jgi:D-alanyl-D-alanine carboxypeptidase
MSRTTFRNASGLPDDEQVTTARDMVTLALRLQDAFPRYYRLFQTRRFTFKGRTYRNHNTLLFNFEGTEGIKTGYTRVSGFNLVASVRRNGRHVVGAVFGGRSASARDAHMRSLMMIALRKASPVKTRKPALVARAVPRPMPAARQRVAAAPSLPQRPTPVPPAPLPSPDRTVAAALPPPAAAPPAPPAAPQTSPATISVARVRPVDVLAQRRTSMASPRRETVIVKSRPRDVAAGTGSAAPAPFIPASSPPAATAAFDRPAPAEPLSGPALPPSTLQAQAMALAGGGDAPRAMAPARQFAMPPAAFGLRPSTASPAAEVRAPTAAALRPRGDYQVQIGAYASQAEAQSRLAAVQARAASLLGAYQPIAIAAESRGKQFYRARYAGFDAAAAAQTCTALRRQQIDCFVAKATP